MQTLVRNIITLFESLIDTQGCTLAHPDMHECMHADVFCFSLPLALAHRMFPAQPIPRGKGRRSKVEKSAAVNRFERQAIEKKAGNTVGPWLMGFFVFVVVGSAVVQIFRTLAVGE
jgi:hypothetical protein